MLYCKTAGLLVVQDVLPVIQEASMVLGFGRVPEFKSLGGSLAFSGGQLLPSMCALLTVQTSAGSSPPLSIESLGSTKTS